MNDPNLGRSLTEAERAALGYTHASGSYISYEHVNRRPLCEVCERQRPGELILCCYCGKYMGPGCTPGCMLAEFPRVARTRLGMCVECIPGRRRPEDRTPSERLAADPIWTRPRRARRRGQTLASLGIILGIFLTLDLVPSAESACFSEVSRFERSSQHHESVDMPCLSSWRSRLGSNDLRLQQDSCGNCTVCSLSLLGAATQFEDPNRSAAMPDAPPARVRRPARSSIQTVQEDGAYARAYSEPVY